MTENQRCCPHCGRVQTFEDSVCPFCGEPIQKKQESLASTAREASRQRTDQHRASLYRHERSSEETESVLDPESRSILKRAAKILGILLAAGAFLWAMAWAVPGGLEEVNEGQAKTAIEYDDPEETAPYMIASYWPFSLREADALDADALWRHPETFDQVFPELTPGELQDLKAAARQVDWQSRRKLLEELREAHFTEEQATAMVDRLEIDWDTQCYKSMRRYFSCMGMTPRKLESQLRYEGFTASQIQAALDRELVDWSALLPAYAADCLQQEALPEKVLLGKLRAGGYSENDIAAWQQQVQVDYRYQALRAARFWDNYYLELDYETLKKEMHDFPQADIDYAAGELGLLP